MSVNAPVCKIRMIDSLNFIPVPLAEMPESFGETELAKGYFPRQFNRKEDQLVTLPHLPDLQYQMAWNLILELNSYYGTNKRNINHFTPGKNGYVIASQMWIFWENVV